MDEHAYEVVNFLPDGFFVYKSRVYTTHNNEEQFLMEVSSAVDLRPVGIH